MGLLGAIEKTAHKVHDSIKHQAHEAADAVKHTTESVKEGAEDIGPTALKYGKAGGLIAEEGWNAFKGTVLNPVKSARSAVGELAEHGTGDIGGAVEDLWDVQRQRGAPYTHHKHSIVADAVNHAVKGEWNAKVRIDPNKKSVGGNGSIHKKLKIRQSHSQSIGAKHRKQIQQNTAQSHRNPYQGNRV